MTTLSCLDCKFVKPQLVWNECTHTKASYPVQGGKPGEVAQHTTVHMRRHLCGNAAVYFAKRT